MNDNLPLMHDAAQQPPPKAWLLLKWVAMTALVAWLTPYVVVALLAAICGLFGVTAAGVRLNVVSLATIQADGWSSMGIAWSVFVWSSGAAVVLWRTWNSAAVRSKRAEAAIRFEAATERAFGPFLERLERLPRAVQAGLLIAGMGMVVLCFAMLPRTERPQRSLTPLGAAQMPTTQPSAALALPGGLIRSGDATVQQRDRDTYVVTFSARAEN